MLRNPRLRRVLRLLIPLALIPAVVALGAAFPEGRRYWLVSLLVASLTVLLFMAGFERRMVGSRRAVLVSVMIALCVAGRFIPLFKPVTAITVLTAVYLGGEAGFTVGAFSALLSNFYFGQGPWTPFQMLAWGLVGLFAGWLSRPLRRSRAALLVYGLLSGVFFSFVMDIWTVMSAYGTPSLALYWSALVTALPHTVLYAVSNGIFLWLLAKPMGEKLERIRIKYGI